MSSTAEAGNHLPDADDLATAPPPGRFSVCRVSDLRLHPSYVRHGLVVPADQLAKVASLDDAAFHEPITTTRDHIILDGYARYELACLKGRQHLRCIELDLSGDETLFWILRAHSRRRGLNDFTRIALALDLEPVFRQKALANQRGGGREKGSSRLTDPQRCDVRLHVALAAGVSTGNVTKVKHLHAKAHPHLLAAVRSGEVSIHRAWTWCLSSQEDQLALLDEVRRTRGIKQTIRQLISLHKKDNFRQVRAVDVAERLLECKEKLREINVGVVKGTRRGVFITEELYRELGLDRQKT